jgi:GNAT superfamily N-acetyltransferase
MTFKENLGSGLVLRVVRDENDIRRFVDFNTTYNNAGEGLTCDCLLRHHPGTTLSDYWLVENENTGEVVSTTCLIPWTLSYEEVELRTAMLEMVLTHPAYRGQGLVRTQIKHFLQEIHARGFDLSIIWGIPYYYRQYGYGYALDGDTCESLPAWRIPDGAGQEPLSYYLQPAGTADIACLNALYQQAAAPLQLHVRRDPPYWDYLLNRAGYPVEMLIHQRPVPGQGAGACSGETAGYAAILRPSGKQSVRLLESGITRIEAGMALLRLLKAQAPVEILINWPDSSTLVRLARGLGSQTVPGGQWLLRIPDIPRFLDKIRPALDRRMAASPWQAATVDLTINLFREAFRLRINSGKLATVDSLGFVDSSMGADGGHLCIPPDAFLRLVFGYRSLEQLQDAWPDIQVRPEITTLIGALFPHMASYLHTPYHYINTG